MIKITKRKTVLMTKSLMENIEQVVDYFKGQYQMIIAVHQENQGNSLYHAHIVMNTVNVNTGKLYHSGRKELSALAMKVHDVTGNYCKAFIK